MSARGHSFRLLLIAATVVSAAPWANAGSLQIPKGPGFESNDLVRDGRPITSDEAIDNATQYYNKLAGKPFTGNPVDGSALAEEANDFRPGKPFPVDSPAQDPAGSISTQLPKVPGPKEKPLTFKFKAFIDGDLTIAQQLLRVRASAPNKDLAEFQLIASPNQHAAFLRAGLLRALGYALPQSRLLPKVTLTFDRLADKKKYLAQLDRRTRHSPDEWGISQADKDGDALTLTLNDVVLTTAQTNLYQLDWAIVPDFPDIDTRPDAFTRSLRALRALIIPWHLTDLGEKLNFYPWQFGSLSQDSLAIEHDLSRFFRNTTWDDARSIARQIGQIPADCSKLGCDDSKLTELPVTWKKIVTYSGYPQPLQALLMEKLKSRRNDLLEILGLSQEAGMVRFEYNPKVDAKDPATGVLAVEQGRVVQERFEGFPQKWRDDDAKPPLRVGEIIRYAFLEAIAAAMQKASEEIEQRFTSRTVDQLAKDHLLEMQKKFLDSVQNGTPWEIKFPGAWGGPIGSASVTASRRVMSGTFYGGTAKAQLVDSMDFNFGVGGFLGFDSITQVGLGALVQFQASRSYLHLVPIGNPLTRKMADKGEKAPEEIEIAPMREALDRDWKELLLPHYFGKLADKVAGKNLKPADPDTGTGSTGPTLPGENPKDGLDSLLSQLKSGETLILTDSVGGGPGLVVNLLQWAGQILADSLPKLLIPTVQATTSFNYAHMKRTTLERTDLSEGGVTTRAIRVNLQTVDPAIFTWGVTAKMFVSLLSFSHSDAWGKAATKTFLLKEPTDTNDRAFMANRLEHILRYNDPRLLLDDEDKAAKYKKWTFASISNDVRASLNKFTLLFRTWWSSSEVSVVRYRPAAPTLADSKKPDFVDTNPQDRERTYIVHNLSSEVGNDFLSFVLSLIPNFTPQVGSDNPANAFLGSDIGTQIHTEFEVTPGLETDPLTIFETHLRGQLIKKDQVVKLLNDMDDRLAPLQLSHRLTDPSAFSLMDTLQLYDISETLAISYKGLTRLRKQLDFVEGANPAVLFRTLIQVEAALDPSPDAYSKALEAHRAWCAANWGGDYKGDDIYPRAGTNYDVSNWEARERDRKHMHAKLFTVGKDTQWVFPCLKEWMVEALWERRAYENLEKKNEEFTWYAQFVKTMTNKGLFTNFLGWLGKNEYSYVVRVSGFRTHEEKLAPKDIGLSDYVSGVLGNAEFDTRGTIRGLSAETGVPEATLRTGSGMISGSSGR